MQYEAGILTRQSVARQRDARALAPSFRFSLVALVLATWLVVGAYVDAWAHHHYTFETFFTPWHALLYSGAGANTAFMIAAWLRNGRSLPRGYGLSLAGCVAFMVSGVGDLAWHTAFGIERDFAAILSPTHLALMASGGLIVTGGFRAAWASNARRLAWTGLWSLTLFLGMLMFFMQDLQPYLIQWPNPEWSLQASLRYAEQLGMDNMLLTTAVLVGLLLLAMGRFQLRPGQVAVLVAFPAIGVMLTYKPDLEMIVPLLAAAFGEGLRVMLAPEGRAVWRLRLYVVALTGFLWGFHMWGLAATDGTWWPIHSEFGVVVVSMAGAWMLSYLARPAPSGVAAHSSEQ